MPNGDTTPRSLRWLCSWPVDLLRAVGDGLIQVRASPSPSRFRANAPLRRRDQRRGIGGWELGRGRQRRLETSGEREHESAETPSHLLVLCVWPWPHWGLRRPLLVKTITTDPTKKQYNNMSAAERGQALGEAAVPRPLLDAPPGINRNQPLAAYTAREPPSQSEATAGWGNAVDRQVENRAVTRPCSLSSQVHRFRRSRHLTGG